MEVRIKCAGITAPVDGFHRLIRRGEVVDLPDAVAEPLLDSGRAVFADEPIEGVSDSELEDETESASDSGLKNETDASERKQTKKKPAKSHSVEEWQAYARGLGITTKGMSKQEIIAAVNQAEA